MAAPRKLTFDDLWTLKTVGTVALSPDGQRVVFELRATDRERNEYCCALWLLHLDEQGRAQGEARRLTAGLKNDTGPVWAPDSRHLLFLSDREGDRKQLYLIDTDGGEACKLTSMQHGVSEAAWSPDGRWIAFTAPVAPSDEDEFLTGRSQRDESAQRRYEERERFGAHHINKIWYRLDGRGLLEKFNQLFIMPAPLAGSDAGLVDPASIRRLTSGDYDHLQPLWTPDSQEIGVLCNRNENRDRSFVSDLWAIDRESGEARCLTEGTLGIACYSWSPDGQAALVVGANDEIVSGRSLFRLYLVTRRGNVGDHPLLLAPDFEKEMFPVVGGHFGSPAPYRPQWSRDGQHVYFLATERGCAHVYRMAIVWRAIEQLTSGENITGFLALLPAEQALLIAQEQPDHPWELYRLPLADGAGNTTGKVEQLTHLYDHFRTDWLWGKSERLHYRGADGDEIDGWLIHPVGAREGVRYPLIVRIHGGPHSAFGIGSNPYDHLLAAQGYAVFYCNPHGSTSYGEAFMRAVIGDWGGRDFQDIMLGVDECIARGVADPERLAVTGYSYGGYMSMFIIGQTDRFKAAVPMAGISDLVSIVFTSDIGFWQAAQAQGYPWEPERADYYRQRSPLTHASRVTTPTLFLHPENDLRCPLNQSEQFYMALKMRGNVPTELVRIPAAWHGSTTKPSQLFDRWQMMLAWFGKYIEIRPQDYT
ncbi:MAG: S9 family peptidase [Ktedonobacteraceae bacterium]|nr:S9 family peptidase [Ktedonobacteraceae bacterium]